MARGWESKAVESQVSDFNSSQQDPKKKQAPVDPEIARRRSVLELARARTVQALESASDPRYQEQLRRALEDLDAKLAQEPGA